MRSRLAIIAMLVSGMVLSTGGGALAVSGFAGQQDNAAQTQYGTNNGNQGNGNQGVLGEEESGNPSGGQDDNGANPNGSAPAGDENEAVQPARQVEAGAQGSGEEQLPFTGFAAIPILLGGVALLASGLVLRRRDGNAR